MKFQSYFKVLKNFTVFFCLKNLCFIDFFWIKKGKRNIHTFIDLFFIFLSFSNISTKTIRKKNALILYDRIFQCQKSSVTSTVLYDYVKYGTIIEKLLKSHKFKYYQVYLHKKGKSWVMSSCKGYHFM